jgi:hypothetical protein
MSKSSLYQSSRILETTTGNFNFNPKIKSKIEHTNLPTTKPIRLYGNETVNFVKVNMSKRMSQDSEEKGIVSGMF